MKKVNTLFFILIFAHSFAQTTATKKPAAKPQTTAKPTTSAKPTTTAKPTVKPATNSTAKKPTTQTSTAKTTSSTKPTSTTSRTTTNSQARPVAPVPLQTRPTTQAQPTQPTVAPAPKPAPTVAPVSTQSQAPAQTSRSSSSKIESVWLGGSIGGGVGVSTNIVNSGIIFPSNLELLFQTRHHRCGIGFASELYLTPESLSRLLFGESPVVKKLYFGYELFLFRNFPVNLGFSTHLGFFGTSTDSTKTAKSNTQDAAASGRGGLFGNLGAVLEIGARPFYFFVRPSIEYKSWSGWHKEIIATGSIGIRLKFLTNYEIKRRADRKRDRDNKY